MVIEAQILSSLSPNVVVGDPVGPSGRNQRKNYEVLTTFYAKQTQFPKKSNERKYLFTNGL